ncbi:MAG: hypothetical protein ABI672_00665 [Vicinamibacteria bacterium]
MYDPDAIPRRSAARLLMSPLAAFYIAIPSAALSEGAELDVQEKVQAEKVAKKLKKAKLSHQDKDEQEAVRHYKKEVAEYLALQKKELARIGPLDPGVVQKALATAITAKRAKARQGDVFRPEIQPLFKRLIAEQLRGPDSKAAQKAVVEGNPGHDEDAIPVAVRVNGAYPQGATHSTVPASVLAALPEILDPLQYFFVGRTLILLDTRAQLIVDYISAAAPELIK